MLFARVSNGEVECFFGRDCVRHKQKTNVSDFILAEFEMVSVSILACFFDMLELIEQWFHEFPEKCKRFMQQAWDEPALLVMVIALVLALVFMQALGHARAMTRRRRRSSLKEDDSGAIFLDGATDTTDPDTESPRSHDPTRYLGDQDISYVTERLDPKQYKRVGVKCTADALQKLFVNEEFRALVKKRSSVPSEFNWQKKANLKSDS